MTSNTKKNSLNTPWKYWVLVFVLAVAAGLTIYFLTSTKANAATQSIQQSVNTDTGKPQVIQNVGNDNIQIQQGDKNKNDIRVNSPTINNHKTTIISKPDTARPNITLNAKNAVVGPNYGHVGDDIYNGTDFKYTQTELSMLYNYGEQLRRDSGILEKSVFFVRHLNGNGHWAYKQLDSLFRSHAYEIRQTSLVDNEFPETLLFRKRIEGGIVIEIGQLAHMH